MKPQKKYQPEKDPPPNPKKRNKKDEKSKPFVVWQRLGWSARERWWRRASFKTLEQSERYMEQEFRKKNWLYDKGMRIKDVFEIRENK